MPARARDGEKTVITGLGLLTDFSGSFSRGIGGARGRRHRQGRRRHQRGRHPARRRRAQRQSPTALRDTLEFSGPDWHHELEDFQDRLGELRVEDAMTRGVISVAPEDAVAEVARKMREERVHRVLVMEKEVLAGIISTFDLVALLERGA
jgi:hypothetical protein